MKKTLFSLFFVATAAVSCTPSVHTTPFVGNWIEIMPANPQIIQGVTLNADGSAQSIGMATLQYEKWLLNTDSTIILFGKSIGNGQTIDFSDTMNVVRITPDSMSLGRFGMYRVDYFRTTSVDIVRPFNVLDSLKTDAALGALEEKTFEGLTPAASNPGIRWTLEIYSQKYSGDGVYKLLMNYLEANNGQDQIDTSYGRLYTLRGDATDKNATVYQLAPFSGGGDTNFLRIDSTKLELVNDKFERAKTELNYTLTLKSTKTVTK